MASKDLSVLRGQRILITGAARGIGAALAEQLASHGARLALIGLEPETMTAVADRCGEGTFVAECDVSSSEQVTQAVDAAAAALDGLDVVVANAGIATTGPLACRICARGSAWSRSTCSASCTPTGRRSRTWSAAAATWSTSPRSPDFRSSYDLVGAEKCL
jgi:NAD(P)-dependent dehydrogenase (short-subunit alcohol dehydrogenase family)